MRMHRSMLASALFIRLTSACFARSSPARRARRSIKAEITCVSAISGNCPLPIAPPDFRFRVAERRAGHAAEMQPVRLVAAILAPRHFVCVLVEVPPANPVMDAVFGAAKAAKPALRIVGASALIALEF